MVSNLFLKNFFFFFFFGITLSSHHHQNEKRESVALSVFFRQYWTDVNLEWNVTEHGGVTSTTFEPKNLWVPDITLYK